MAASNAPSARPWSVGTRLADAALAEGSGAEAYGDGEETSSEAYGDGEETSSSSSEASSSTARRA